MEENEIYAALDLEQPQGETEQDTADPADLTGDKEQETADPAQDNDATEPKADQPEEPKEQTKEERAKFAAQRRKAEMDAAIKDAVDKANKANQEQWERFFREAGIPNPANNGEPLKSLDEFEDYLKWRDAASIADKAQKGEMTEAEIRDTIDRRAEERAKELARKYTAEQMEADTRIKDQISKIHAMDPSINTIQDLLTMENGAAFRKYVQKGNDFVDAYYLANRDAIERQRADEAARQAVNSARSKDHLTATKTKGSGGLVDVPSSEMALFRELMPDAKPSDIKAYYNKYLAKK